MTSPVIEDVALLPPTVIDIDAGNAKPAAKCRRSVCRHLCAQVPWIVMLLSIAQCVVYVFFNDAAAQNKLLFTRQQKGEAWRYLSYSMTHVSVQHLGINVALQLLVGSALEIEQGHGRVLAVWLLGVCGGALAADRYEPRRSLAGASAGVFGLLMSHIPHTAMNFQHLSYRWFRPLAIAILSFCDLVDIVRLSAGLYQHRVIAPSVAISLVAHIGGAVAGLLAGTVLFRAQVESWAAILVVYAVRVAALVGTVCIVISMCNSCAL